MDIREIASLAKERTALLEAARGKIGPPAALFRLLPFLASLRSSDETVACGCATGWAVMSAASAARNPRVNRVNCTRFLLCGRRKHKTESHLGRVIRVSNLQRTPSGLGALL